MSRLIVKGLPSNCTECMLRKHFGVFGQITDCSLKYTANGKFRRFAFVGFENEANAREAREQLHNTFIGPARLLACYNFLISRAVESSFFLKYQNCPSD